MPPSGMLLPGTMPPSALPAENDEMDSSRQEEVLLDETAEAARFDFYMVGGLETSPDHQMLDYAEDTSGNEKYTLHVKELSSDKELLREPIKVGLHAAPHARALPVLTYLYLNVHL